MKNKKHNWILVISCFILVSSTFIFSVDSSGSNDLGYEFLENNTVFHIWNTYDDYYFNRSNGVQFTNHYEEYWTHNILMIGYYDNEQWNLLYRTDELSGFTEVLDYISDDYINITLWKDLSYGSYDFRLALRYHLGVNDFDLTVVPYIKNLGVAIPFDIGFGWEMKDIKINNDVYNDYIAINGSSYLLNQSLNYKYSNLTRVVYSYNETTNVTTNYTVKDGFFCLENLNSDTEKVDYNLYLKWNPELDYLVTVKSRNGQYNAPVTLFIKVGALIVAQEKYTKLFWHDSDTLYERYNVNDDGDSGAYGIYWKAQTFTIGNTGINEDHDVTSVKLLIYRVGDPGTVAVSIRAVDGENKPTGSDLTSGTIVGGDLTENTAGEWKEISLTPYGLSASTQYAIVVKAVDGDGFNNVHWRVDYSSPTYTGGKFAHSANSGDTWTLAATSDFLFEVYGVVDAPWSNTCPVSSGESPANKSTGVSIDIGYWNITINDADGNTTTGNITCSNGNWSSWSGQANGTRSCSLSILSYSTNYTVWVNFTDTLDICSENETYWFVTEDEAENGTCNCSDFFNESELIAWLSENGYIKEDSKVEINLGADQLLIWVVLILIIAFAVLGERAKKYDHMARGIYFQIVGIIGVFGGVGLAQLIAWYIPFTLIFIGGLYWLRSGLNFRQLSRKKG